MLRSRASRSMISAGVSTWATGTPISAGGGFIRLRCVLWTPPYSMAEWLVYDVASSHDQLAEGKHNRTRRAGKPGPQFRLAPAPPIQKHRRTQRVFEMRARLRRVFVSKRYW